MQPKQPFKPTFAVEFISPEDAQSMLQDMTPRQRPVNLKWVTNLAAEIKAGRYAMTPDPIVREECGKYINGQHRLHAIVKSGVGVWMVVTEGWPAVTFDVMDAGVRRALQHRADKLWLRNGTRPIAVVRATVHATMPNYQSMTEGQVIAVADAGEHWFIAVLEAVRESRTPAMIQAACVRAHMNGVSLEKIARFTGVYNNPETMDGPEESAAVLLHRKVNGMKSRGLGGSTNREFIYRSSASALDHFVHRRSITKLYGREDDFFPLPPAILTALRSSENIDPQTEGVA